MENFYCGNKLYNYLKCHALSLKDYAVGKICGDGVSMFCNLKEGYALYEELPDNRRIYFDLDGLADSHPLTYVRNLIKTFADDNGLKNVTFTMTMNKGSRHPGKGLHIVLNKVMHWKDMRNTVRAFINRHQDYKGVIDPYVYNERQLMRMPYSGNAIQNIQYQTMNSWDIKKEDEKQCFELLKTTNFNYYDFHEVISGKIDDMMIQNIEGLEVVKTSNPDIIVKLDAVFEREWLKPAYNKNY